MKNYILAFLVIALLFSAANLPEGDPNSCISVGVEDGEGYYSIKNLDSYTKILADFSRNMAIDKNGILKDYPSSSSRSFRSITYYDVKETQLKSVQTDFSGSLVGEHNLHYYQNVVTYMDGARSYYIIKGSANVSYEDHSDRDGDIDNSYNRYAIYDVQIYVDANHVMFKLNRLEVYYNRASDDKDEEYTYNPDAFNKWIQLPFSYSDEVFALVNATGADTLNEVQNLISTAQTNDTVHRDGDIYEIEADTYDEEDTNLRIDLSDRKAPSASLVLDSSSEVESIYIFSDMTFRDINNTVIDVDFDGVLVFDSMSEFMDFLED